LGSASNSKNRKENATIFEGYLSDIQENITNTWRVTPEEITQYQGIDPTSNPLDMRCGSRHGNIPIINGYNCTTASSPKIRPAGSDLVVYMFP
jgi:hypothetical protein